MWNFLAATKTTDLYFYSNNKLQNYNPFRCFNFFWNKGLPYWSGLDFQLIFKIVKGWFSLGLRAADLYELDKNEIPWSERFCFDFSFLIGAVCNEGNSSLTSGNSVVGCRLSVYRRRMYRLTSLPLPPLLPVLPCPLPPEPERATEPPRAEVSRSTSAIRRSRLSVFDLISEDIEERRGLLLPLDSDGRLRQLVAMWSSRIRLQYNFKLR